MLHDRIIANATKFPAKPRWHWVMKDTSVFGSPSIVRTKQGDLRLSTLDEDLVRSWRNEC